MHLQQQIDLATHMEIAGYSLVPAVALSSNAPLEMPNMPKLVRTLQYHPQHVKARVSLKGMY